MGRELEINYRPKMPIPATEFQAGYIKIPLSENNSFKKRRKR
jgi:hypothetical protein